MRTPQKLRDIAAQVGMEFSLGAGGETEIYTLRQGNQYELVLSTDIKARNHSDWYPKYVISFRPAFKPFKLFHRIYRGGDTAMAVSGLLDILTVLNERTGRRANVHRGIRGLNISLADAVRLHGLDVKSYLFDVKPDYSVLITASGELSHLYSIANGWSPVRTAGSLAPTDPMVVRPTRTLMYEI